jgi:hypothetical protein
MRFHIPLSVSHLPHRFHVLPGDGIAGIDLQGPLEIRPGALIVPPDIIDITPVIVRIGIAGIYRYHRAEIRYGPVLFPSGKNRGYPG